MGKSVNRNQMADFPRTGLQNENPRAVMPRDQVDDWEDPYLSDGHREDGTVCSQCGAVYHNHHWTLDEAQRDVLLAAGTPNQVICPGCKKFNERNPHGIVTLRGDYWPQHREDILNLIHNEEGRGMNTNPLERIMDIREDAGALIIETTNEKLAQRIGRSVHSAHKGNVEYKWPDGNRLVRVDWERNG